MMRILLCGLIAGGVWTLLSVAVLAFVGGDFLATLPGVGLAGPGTHRFLFAINVAAGVWAMWLYAALRPRYGRGTRTALIAGLAWWIIASIQSGKWVAVTGVPRETIFGPLVGTLLAIVAATVIGAWAYERTIPGGMVTAA